MSHDVAVPGDLVEYLLADTSWLSGITRRWPWRHLRTNYELNGLTAREIQGKKVILPIWHPEMALQDLLGISPTLADKKALVAGNLSTEEIADEFAALIQQA